MYTSIIEKNVKESFLNIEMVLRIYLTLLITNCTGERSFSKLKFKKKSTTIFDVTKEIELFSYNEF